MSKVQSVRLSNEKGHQLGTPGHSIALRYEVLLCETGLSAEESIGGVADNDPTHSRINTCFQILDDILPHLGVYQRVIQLIRKELKAAVYSNEYTGAIKSGNSKSAETSDGLIPLPYFVLAQRHMSKRAGEQSKMKAEIASLKEQLYTCEADLEKASTALDAYKHDVKERDSRVHRLTSELRSCYAECERLKKLVNHNQKTQDRLRQEVEFRMFSLRSSISNLKMENSSLRVYKNTHDTLQEVLATPITTTTNGNTQHANNKTQMAQHIDTTDHLREQLLTMQNSLVDEYDQWMNKCTVGDEQTQVLPAAVIKQKQTFKQNIAEITNELSLLTDHATCLSSRLKQVESTKSTSSHMALVLPSHPHNPLVPQLQTNSKYAIMIYTSSDGGTTFYPLKDTQLCHSCGQKTVVCPHKGSSGEQLIQLPVSSTHIKISRPALQLVVKTTASKPDVVSRRSTDRVHSKQGLHATPPDFDKLWSIFEEFYPQYSNTVHRRLTQDQLLLLSHQFIASVLLHDDKAQLGDDEHPPTFMESLFEFMIQRYQVKSIVPLASHNFLSALSLHYRQHKELLVLSHILCGNLDGCSLRYLLLLANLVQVMPWHSVKEFPSFAALLYPALQEEDMEQLTMNFIAHSGNRISASLVMDYITLLLLRHREPLILMLEGQLLEQPSKKTGVLLEVEFAEAMEMLLPVNCSYQLCRRLFLQNLAAMETEGRAKRETLPIKQLAYIAGYLYALGVASSVKMGVDKLVHKCVATATSQSQQSAATEPSHSSSHSEEALPYTMDTVRTMANRMKAIASYK